MNLEFSLPFLVHLHMLLSFMHSSIDFFQHRHRHLHISAISCAHSRYDLHRRILFFDSVSKGVRLSGRQKVLYVLELGLKMMMMMNNNYDD